MLVFHDYKQKKNLSYNKNNIKILISELNSLSVFFVCVRILFNENENVFYRKVTGKMLRIRC